MQRLNQHCAAVNFIIPQQCGFRPKCSTVHQLLRVTELIHSGFAKHEATEIIKMGRTILLERRQSESVGRRNSRTTFLRSDWPRPFARREVGVEMELGRSENKRPEQSEILN
ncbi:hypothetical protein TNCV_1717531 [Trichonephila clavipes]|nr:hypothetical protein TNCV_1717531 [Trichonephila clavipes]